MGFDFYKVYFQQPHIPHHKGLIFKGYHPQVQLLNQGIADKGKQKEVDFPS